MNRLGRMLGCLIVAPILSAIASSTIVLADDQAAIRALEDHLAAAFSAKDVDRVMSCYLPDESLVIFDSLPPRQYVGAKAFRKDNEDFLANYPGPVNTEINDLSITADSKLGFAHYIGHVTATNKEGKPEEFVYRVTDCLRKVKGKWLITHEHVSFPVDPTSGKADFLSKP